MLRSITAKSRRFLEILKMKLLIILTRNPINDKQNSDFNFSNALPQFYQSINFLPFILSACCISKKYLGQRISLPEIKLEDT